MNGCRRRLLRCSTVLALACAGLVAGRAPRAKHVLQLRIARRKIGNAPATIRVTAGDLVELRWTTDEATTVHLHGYDLTLVLEPGTEGRMRFEANATGRFPISTHGFGTAPDKGANREVVLLYLEVHPA